MNGHNQKRGGGPSCGPNLKRGGGGLRCWSGNKGVFTVAHTCTGHIYKSPT